MTVASSQCSVSGLREVAENIFVLRFASPFISRVAKAGQFVNIRVAETADPLLRRPFSIHRLEGQFVEIIFNVVGRGTASLRHKRAGDVIDVLGPLGVPYSLEGDDFSTGILIGGGLGVAPFPFVTATLLGSGKNVETFLGARTKAQLATDSLHNLHVATDDGSAGFYGTVVDLVRETLANGVFPKPKIFACGPTPMLRAVARFALAARMPCEVSLEGPMGCGIGICQGCPVELTGGEKKYALLCKDGPIFDVRSVRL